MMNQSSLVKMRKPLLQNKVKQAQMGKEEEEEEAIKEVEEKVEEEVEALLTKGMLNDTIATNMITLRGTVEPSKYTMVREE